MGVPPPSPLCPSLVCPVQREAKRSALSRWNKNAQILYKPPAFYNTELSFLHPISYLLQYSKLRLIARQIIAHTA